MLRTHQFLQLALILLLSLQKCASFSITKPSIKCSNSCLYAKSAKNKADDVANVDGNVDFDAENEERGGQQSSNDQPSIDLAASQPGSSDLRVLLPKPSSRPLKLDKFGRRIYNMQDDNTIKLTKGEGSPGTSTSSTEPTKNSPELSTLLQSSKEIASLESSANFRSISTSSDLKALLPKREMKWRTLDKFGRRVQIMEDEVFPPAKETTRSESDVTASQRGTAPPLSELLQGTKEITGYEEAERNFREFKTGSDLKALLPKRKMTWMKLDKLGRRVERMEDDGTVNKRVGQGVDEHDASADVVEEVEANAVDNAVLDNNQTVKKVDQADTDVDDEAEVDVNEMFLTELLKVGDDKPQPTPRSSRNLKELLPSKPIWTKLDFKGGSVEDERRTKRAPVDDGNKMSSLKTLLLQSKKPTWTKLDFKGVGVEDESRTKQTTSEDKSSPNGEYTNLKTLLPERKIQWGTRGKPASISGSSVETDLNSNKGVSLKTLLPERKVTWRDDDTES